MSEEQAQMLQQMQMLENMLQNYHKKENSIKNIIRDADSAIKSIQELKQILILKVQFRLEWALYQNKTIPNEKIVLMSVQVLQQKKIMILPQFLESKIKELEVALQETNPQRQQIAANLEQGKQQM